MAGEPGRDTRRPPVRVGVISDTHVPERARAIPDAVFQVFQGVDAILHAGDLTGLDVLARLGRVAPVAAVAGNMDPPPVWRALGRRRVVELGGVRIGLVHGDEGRAATIPLRALEAFRELEGLPVRVVVFGHSHMPYAAWHDDVLLVNPGSATNPRGGSQASVAILTLGEVVEVEHVPVPRR